jgi:putative FmdB family regulatory protein
MAVYSYKCSDKSHAEPITFQVERGIRDQAEATLCPQCDQPAQRIFSVPAITFNGSGWGRD